MLGKGEWRGRQRSAAFHQPRVECSHNIRQIFNAATPALNFADAFNDRSLDIHQLDIHGVLSAERAHAAENDFEIG
jgi:hypothetical protein